MKVAIVHYWLVNMRGGEKVIEELLDIFPQADIFTNVYDPKNISKKINSKNIYTTKINSLPFAKKMYQKYMPFMPNALMSLDLSGYDLIISSESGPAKGVVPNPDAFHICYCHTPMRYLWDMYHEYFNKSGLLTRLFMKKMIPSLRNWDITSSHLVDYFVCNSSYVSQRVRRYYQRESTVIYPPVDIERFASIERKPKDFYLFFGQLVGYKRADLAIDACIKTGKELVIIGDGKIKRKLPNNIKILGKQPDSIVEQYLATTKALIFPGIEDFGIIPVEANASGCPVIAFRKGGATETVLEDVTGVFFEEQTTESLISAMIKLESSYEKYLDKDQYINHVSKFSRDIFKEKIKSIVDKRQRL